MPTRGSVKKTILPTTEASSVVIINFGKGFSFISFVFTLIILLNFFDYRTIITLKALVDPKNTIPLSNTILDEKDDFSCLVILKVSPPK
jgi:hypothetical protein